MEYIAHIDQSREQTLLEHLTEAARLASEFAKPFGSAEEAYKCGLMHDIGKYSDAFQRRIRGENIRVDHSSAGAVECARDGAAAFCIAGHHGGLSDRGGRTDKAGDGTLKGVIQRRPGRDIEDYLAYKSEVAPAEAAPPAALLAPAESAFFYIHMLYSCLVDADWLDTERFMSEGKVERGTGRPLAELWSALEKHIEKWWSDDRPLNVRRCKILRELMDAGHKAPGLYTLTVPTGGGKTVSSMAFALRHALKNGLRRIIYVIPYTSIIEQTQAVFEEIFGSENVVAHYANVEYKTDENGNMSDSDTRRYLASENWDAPVILTTAVQFFESLYSNRPSSCRKLHNIAGSVIIFDEAQMLPISYLRPCVFAITELIKNYGCTGVLCTATQPSLGALVEKYLPAGADELCGDTRENYDFFRRVTFKREGELSDETLAERLGVEAQALCVVNSRHQAQKLYSRLPGKGKFHLSTTMTPIHRRKMLEKIRKRLKDGLACRVISTSLIEAGVDVDFPCVYRATAGLDSIIQTAGRCNREGKRPAVESVVHVFDTEAKAPAAIRQNIAAARHVMEKYDDMASPEAIEAYFNFLYFIKGEDALDEKRIIKLMTADMAFETVARKFKLIEENTRTVYIPLDGGEALIKELLEHGASRDLMRRLGQYAVSVYERDYLKLDKLGAIRPVFENAAILINTDYYSEETGLSLSPEGGEAKFG